ncbi:VOC family protein [Jannaschia seohaensis]|uniref:Catechol 2,3-dioxygenase n=1 Tax=Jannaschia seohaensis TaxID=475081 RepID=A0A2Y9A358_9RHOB|nr:VOC family protein [Jannaschia seohaensis]PWJ22367.1 catechol 2,3-dioxygenase-like lactoylglutathione lyase family enzyme [Jannaschia seohaensis]SSA38645.1 Catechol 2,3-dioxygenase [Jannaschia seohaensis]
MQLEHVNLTVRDPDATADVLSDLLDWHVRWSGPAKDGGYSVHVGDDDSYVALYAPKGTVADAGSSYVTHAAVNHLGVVTDDLDAAEARVKAAGYTPHNHADYEPGRRFYFDGPEGIEIEMVSYR